MPRLSTSQGGVGIFTYGNPLNVSLPSLSSTAYISLAGTIGTSVAFQPIIVSSH